MSSEGSQRVAIGYAGGYAGSPDVDDVEIDSSSKGSSEEELPDYDENGVAIGMAQEGIPTTAVAAKAPASQFTTAYVPCPEIYDDSDDGEPDLGAYLSGYGFDAWAQIRLCRTYANMLAAKMRTPSKKKAKKF